MDNINNSFKGYGKVDPAEEEAFRRKTRRRLAVLAVSSIVFVAVIVGAVVSVVVKSKSDGVVNDRPVTATSLKFVCSVTEYPQSCYSSISSLNTANSTDPQVIFNLSLQVLHDSLFKLKDLPSKLSLGVTDDFLSNALSVCSAVFDDAYATFNDVLSAVNGLNAKKILTSSMIDDVKTWLSSVITNQQTCIDSLMEGKNSSQPELLLSATRNSTEFASNSLAIMAKILGLMSSYNGDIHRKLLFNDDDGELPAWINRRSLLRSNPKPDVTVAKDGSGDVKTIGDAVARIPNQSSKRFVIYIKAGVYREQVTIGQSSWNVMIYGDGINKTVITAQRSVADNITTFATATFAVVGKKFVARDISFVNTAGPAKHQAVAFRSGSDTSVYIRCAFDAYQDTLYAHSNRQLYTGCLITGTVDFIFGNAAAVFQNCNIQPRQPMANQYNTVTAQGKMDPNQNTGISILKSRISANGQVTVKTYLGRPWKNYSTTVVMNSDIGPLLSPDGWSPWIYGVTPPNTIFYGEYLNTGPGSRVAQRVTWGGVHSKMSNNQAKKYTVNSFIKGNVWLPAVIKGL